VYREIKHQFYTLSTAILSDDHLNTIIWIDNDDRTFTQDVHLSVGLWLTKETNYRGNRSLKSNQCTVMACMLFIIYKWIEAIIKYWRSEFVTRIRNIKQWRLLRSEWFSLYVIRIICHAIRMSCKKTAFQNYQQLTSKWTSLASELVTKRHIVHLQKRFSIPKKKKNEW